MTASSDWLGARCTLELDFFLTSGGAQPTTLDDAAEDVRTGSTDLDWYLASLDDVITDLHSGESIS